MPKQPKQEPVKIDNPGGSKIELSAPWANGLSNAGLINACTMLEALGGKPEEGAMMRTFISARSAVHREYIQQSEKTKRFGYGLSALLLAGAIVVPVLAPQGRETISWVTAA